MVTALKQTPSIVHTLEQIPSEDHKSLLVVIVVKSFRRDTEYKRNLHVPADSDASSEVRGS